MRFENRERDCDGRELARVQFFFDVAQTGIQNACNALDAGLEFRAFGLDQQGHVLLHCIDAAIRIGEPAADVAYPGVAEQHSQRDD